MLTDRQQKFYFEIRNLTSNLEQSPERQYLWQACDALYEGKDFKRTINQLNINLRELEKYPAGLSQGTKELYQKLVEIYGEPVGEPPKSVFSKNWYISNDNPDLVFQGAWTSRKILDKQRTRGCTSIIMSALVIAILSDIILAFLWTPLLPWLEEKLGATVFYIIISVVTIVVFALLIITGNLRPKKNKSNKTK